MRYLMPDQPRSLKSRDVREARRAMLHESHMLPLTKYVEQQRQRKSELEIPHFDPLDGGTNARVLFLFEKPGPMTSIDGKRGSGFISRDNDDKTAEATFKFMRQAKLTRESTIIWNVVPGWNGTRKITSAELKAGCEEVDALIRLLPKLQSIVFVGKKAAKAKDFLTNPKIRFYCSPHPSPIVAATNRAMWESIPEKWAKVA